MILMDEDEIYEEYGQRSRHRKAALPKRVKPKKADHKHVYEDCYVSYVAEDYYGKTRNLFAKAKYCTVCGKLDCNWYKTINQPTDDSLPMFDVEMWGKEVKLDERG